MSWASPISLANVYSKGEIDDLVANNNRKASKAKRAQREMGEQQDRRELEDRLAWQERRVRLVWQDRAARLARLALREQQDRQEQQEQQEQTARTERPDRRGSLELSNRTASSPRMLWGRLKPP